MKNPNFTFTFDHPHNWGHPHETHSSEEKKGPHQKSLPYDDGRLDRRVKQYEENKPHVEAIGDKLRKFLDDEYYYWRVDYNGRLCFIPWQADPGNDFPQGACENPNYQNQNELFLVKFMDYLLGKLDSFMDDNIKVRGHSDWCPVSLFLEALESVCGDFSELYFGNRDRFYKVLLPRLIVYFREPGNKPLILNTPYWHDGSSSERRIQGYVIETSRLVFDEIDED